MSLQERLSGWVQELAGVRGPVGNRNLYAVIVPTEQAWQAREMLKSLVSSTPMDLIDFDAEVIQMLGSTGWNRALEEQRAVRSDVLRSKVRAAAEQVGDLPGVEPLIVTNINLPVAAGWEGLGALWYERTAKRVILAVLAGVVRDHRVLLHGKLPFAGLELLAAADEVTEGI